MQHFLVLMLCGTGAGAVLMGTVALVYYWGGQVPTYTPVPLALGLCCLALGYLVAHVPPHDHSS